jgi:AcrR family transcriptional regulator
MVNGSQYARCVDDVKKSVEDEGTRAYHSPLREEAARITRLRILQAAHELFLEQGFAATSIADIASAADVARPSVLSVFGTKATILKEVVDVSMAGDDGPVPVAQQPWFQPVWRARTPAGCLDAYARVCLLIGRRASGVIEVVRRAADEGPEIAGLWNVLQRNRRFGAGTIVTRVRALGGTRHGLSEEQAGDRLFMLNDSALYLALVTERGWDERTLERWLASNMRHNLL